MKTPFLSPRTLIFIASMGAVVVTPLKANWVRNCQIFSNAIYSYSLINNLSTEPTKAKLCLAGIGLATGYIAGKSLNEDQDYADAYIGHAIGIPLGLVTTWKNPNSQYVKNFGTIGILGGGFFLGTSLRHFVDSQSKQTESSNDVTSEKEQPMEKMLQQIFGKRIRITKAPDKKEPEAQTVTTCDKESYTFANLAGTIPQDVREVADFINQSEKYRAIGAHMPKGILLVGPPGTGKTSIARAIAGEVHAHFFSAKGTQFVEQYVGLGASRVRELFEEAREAVKAGTCKKAIIFIDEIDALGSRATNLFGGSSEYKTTMNELLCQLDGFEQDDSIFIIAATNRVEDLDPALTRSGRFDRIVTIGLPDEKSREAIVRLHTQKIKTDDSINYTLIAQKTQGLNCADLANLVNEAAIHAVREKAEIVSQIHFEKVFQTNEKYRNAH